MPVPELAAAARLAVQPPGPERFWIRFVPRAWPAPAGPWTDLARATLGAADPRAAARVERPLDDVLYLPPAAPEAVAERERTARARLADGTPVVLQTAPGDPPPPPGATAVCDLLAPLLARDLAPLAEVAATAAVWPLVPGLTDDPELWRDGCRRLAAAGVETVQALSLELSPAARRRLAAAGGEAAFDALFHRPPPSERAFARVAHAAGLNPFLDRPLPRAPRARAGNRRLAGALLTAAELWLRLGRPAGRALALGRAARWIDEAPYDVGALTREGNLAVVEQVDAECRRLLEAWIAAGRFDMLEELQAEYVAGAVPA